MKGAVAALKNAGAQNADESRNVLMWVCETTSKVTMDVATLPADVMLSNAILRASDVVAIFRANEISCCSLQRRLYGGSVLGSFACCLLVVV